MQDVPLPEEQELGKTVKLNILHQGAEGFGDGTIFPEPQAVFPGIPGLTAVLLLQRHKQGVIRKPPVVLRPEPVKGFSFVLIAAESLTQNV